MVFTLIMAIIWLWGSSWNCLDSLRSTPKTQKADLRATITFWLYHKCEFIHRVSRGTFSTCLRWAEPSGTEKVLAYSLAIFSVRSTVPSGVIEFNIQAGQTYNKPLSISLVSVLGLTCWCALDFFPCL